MLLGKIIYLEPWFPHTQNMRLRPLAKILESLPATKLNKYHKSWVILHLWYKIFYTLNLFSAGCNTFNWDNATLRHWSTLCSKESRSFILYTLETQKLGKQAMSLSKAVTQICNMSNEKRDITSETEILELWINAMLTLKWELLIEIIF